MKLGNPMHNAAFREFLSEPSQSETAKRLVEFIRQLILA